VLHKSVELTDFIAAKSPAILQPNRIEPKLGRLVFSFDMHMSRLVPVTSIEKKPVLSLPQNSWHYLNLKTMGTATHFTVYGAALFESPPTRGAQP
jgi:hypothetical protein